MRHSDLRETATALQMRDAYRLHTLQAAIHERTLKTIMSALSSAGVDALLAKGWATALLYPEPGLRPYGDFDVCVQPDQYAAAVEALSRAGVFHDVDLHHGLAELDDRSLLTLYTRSRKVLLGDTEIKILGPEDQLRLLCLHLLRHGAFRPLWLCDIAVTLESVPADFDWEYFFSGSRPRGEWLMCTIHLAHKLLGARLDHVPTVVRDHALPRWLVPAVLRQWERGWSKPVKLTARDFRHPNKALRELRERWPNPIEATMRLRAEPNDLPRLPYQLGDFILRAVLSTARLEQLHAKLVDHQ